MLESGNKTEKYDNKLYHKELYDHKLFCNGEGDIEEINGFTGRLTTRPCKFCHRLKNFVDRRKMTFSPKNTKQEIIGQKKKVVDDIEDIDNGEY